MGSLFARPSGALALDFVNTLDWRDDPARRVELLTAPAALGAWARHAALPQSGGEIAEAQLVRALRLREGLAVLFRAVAARRPMPEPETASLSDWTRLAWRHRELIGSRKGVAWGWTANTSAADRILFEVVLDAGRLLLSDDRRRVRICGGAGCGWFFVDRSRAGRRRWCSMTSCGNRAKVRAYRRRVAHA